MRDVYDALSFAALRHRHQRRKGERGAPYVNHLIEVLHLLSTHGERDTDTLRAALLHDTIEDAAVSAIELEERFGPRVSAIVLELTDDERLPVWERKLGQVEGASSLSEPAQQIRVADKISNLRGVLTSPPERWSLERKVAYYAWAEQVVRNCDQARDGLLQTFRAVHDAGLAALSMRRLHRDLGGRAP